MCGGGVTQGVGHAIVLEVWCSGTVCILMLSRLCCVSGNVCGLSEIFTEILEERDAVVLGALPSVLVIVQCIK